MNVATLLSTLAQVSNAPSDPDWHDHAVLLGKLATLNAHIARYITRALDVDAERGEPIKDSEEATLGQALVDLGERLRERSQRRPEDASTVASHTNPS